MIITTQAIREAGSRCGRKITRAITPTWTRKSSSAPRVEKNEYSVMPSQVLYQSPAPVDISPLLVKTPCISATTVWVLMFGRTVIAAAITIRSCGAGLESELQCCAKLEQVALGAFAVFELVHPARVEVEIALLP